MNRQWKLAIRHITEFCLTSHTCIIGLGEKIMLLCIEKLKQIPIWLNYFLKLALITEIIKNMKDEDQSFNYWDLSLLLTFKQLVYMKISSICKN